MQRLDEMVLRTQQYLNSTYSGNVHWVKVTEDGKTGWGTIRGLIRALQIETGISTPNGTFGPATEAACPTLKKDLNPTDKTKRLVYILQGAMWCKGFSPGGFTGTFGDGTEAGVKKFQSSAGLEGAKVNGVADPMIFKALLNMDAYVLVSSGDPKIREIQMCLNRDYHKWIGLRPTDGRYGRDTNKALIYAIQVEEGIAEPNGTFGPQTQSLLPTLAPGSTNKPFVKIMQYALYCNRFDPTGFTGVFGNGTLAALKKFQAFCKLTADGYCGKSTWCSLMISCGDKDRKGTACDCSSEVTPARAKTLKANGYEIVGRYIAGGDWKKLKMHEAKVIFENGLRLFPIFQKSGNSVSYFTPAQGTKDADEAIVAAAQYGFPRGTTIYFAVDFDAVDDQVTSNILPYFRNIKKAWAKRNPRGLKIGVYGPRNVCSRVGKEGISSNSFVCDMSTGFSGNLGYPLPEDWAFDQIKEFTIGSGDGAIAIDNNICSNRDKGISKFDSAIFPSDPDEPTDPDKPTDPNEPPTLTPAEETKLIQFARERGLFKGSPFNIDIQLMNTKYELYRSLKPNMKVEGEFAYTAQLVGPYKNINFYMEGDAFTAHLFDAVGKGGLASDFKIAEGALTNTFNRLRLNDDFASKYMKYTLDVSIDSVLLTLEVPLTIPAEEIYGEGNANFDNIVLYQRLHITIKKDLSNPEWYIPAPLLVDESTPDIKPSHIWSITFGFIGIMVCSMVAFITKAPQAFAAVGASGIGMIGLSADE